MHLNYIIILGLIIVFVIVLVYVYRSKTERFDTEEANQSAIVKDNSADSYIILYDVESNLGKNLQNTEINYLYPKNNSSRDDNIDIQLYYKSETTSKQHLESEGIIYELRENGLYLNGDSEIDTSDTFAPGEFLIQIAYNGAHGIWILTTFNKIYSYTINEGFIEYSEPIEHVKTDPPLLIFGNMNKQDSLYYITTKGSLYNLYSKDPILDYKNGAFVVRVSQYKNTVAYITSSYQIYIYDVEKNESRQVARGSNSLLAANNTHVFYVKEIESEHFLYKLNHKVVDSKEELCLYGELRPGTGKGGGGISDLSILDTLKSGNIVAYVLSQKLECSKTQNYVDFIDEEGKHTCVCREHHFRSEADNNTCIPCNKAEKRLNTPNTKLVDTCTPLICEVNLTNANTGSNVSNYLNTKNLDKMEIDVDKNIFNASRQTYSNYNIVSFDNSNDELCSTFVYGGTKFSEHSPYLQLTKSGYIFREEDYMKTLQNIDITTYITSSLSNMATTGYTNMKNWKIDEIDQRAIIQDEINSICFENTALSSILDKDKLCPRPEKSTAKCPFDSMLFEDKACQKVPPGAVIDTENEPIYDSLTDGHRITKYSECKADTYANKDECTPCEPGSFSKAMSTECSVCEPGSIVNSNSTGCVKCLAGEFMSEDLKCVKCPKNHISKEGSTSCTTCPENSSPTSDQTNCLLNDWQGCDNDNECLMWVSGDIEGTRCRTTGPNNQKRCITQGDAEYVCDADYPAEHPYKMRYRPPTTDIPVDGCECTTHPHQKAYSIEIDGICFGKRSYNLENDLPELFGDFKLEAFMRGRGRIGWFVQDRSGGSSLSPHDKQWIPYITRDTPHNWHCRTHAVQKYYSDVDRVSIINKYKSPDHNWLNIHNGNHDYLSAGKIEDGKGSRDSWKFYFHIGEKDGIRYVVPFIYNNPNNGAWYHYYIIAPTGEDPSSSYKNHTKLTDNANDGRMLYFRIHR